MTHGRKYGEKDSHPIPLWNGVFEHYDRLGDALWEFAWCIDSITRERDGVGLVLGGSPVKLSAIVKALKGSDKETVRRHLKMLVEGKYIQIRRTPYGQVIEVLNSKKFGIWKREKPQNAVSPLERNPSMSQRNCKMQSEKLQNAVSKEDSAVTQQKDTAVGSLPLASFWPEMGIDPKKLPGRIRKLCEGLYAEKGDQTPVEFLSACMDGIQGMGWHIPPQIAQATAELRANGGTHQRRPIPELEAEPWGGGEGVK